MGITPISNLAPLPVTRAIEDELEPLPMERVENTARADDATYSPSNQGSAGDAEDNGFENNGSQEEGSDDFQCLIAEQETQPSTDPAAEPSSGRISFLA
jgi:hypothetical protein